MRNRSQPKGFAADRYFQRYTMNKKLSAITTTLLILCLVAALSACSLWDDLVSPKFTVTFDDGISETEVSVSKGNTVTLPEPTKTGYTFGGWYDQKGNLWTKDTKVTEHVVLTARWNPIPVQITFVVNGASVVVECDYGKIPVYPEGTPHKPSSDTQDFPFLGWQPALTKATEPTTYTAEFGVTPRTFEIYLNSEYPQGFTASDTSVQIGNDVTVSLSIKNGFKFLGWYDQSGNKLGSDYQSLKHTFTNVTADVTVEVRIEPITYNIYYHDVGLCHNPNPTRFDVTMDGTKLEPLSKDGYFFDGWYTAADGKGQRVEELTVELISANNNLYAYFTKQVTATFCINGKAIDSLTQKVNVGGTVNRPIVDGKALGMSGYTADGWYSDEACTSAVAFPLTANEPITLYGKWKAVSYTPQSDVFDKFDAQVKTGTVKISNRNELELWVDYVHFNSITSADKISLEFTDGYNVNCNSASELNKLVNDLNNKSTFPAKQALVYSYNKNDYVLTSLTLQSTNQITPNSVVGDTLDQQFEFAFTWNNDNPRDDAFDDFAIYNLTERLNVQTTNQLVYAMENGYLPVAKSGSAADSALTKAKAILNKIIGTYMTDFEKVKAIYDYLVLNVRYDKAALSPTYSDNWMQYKAWQAEGVFDDYRAVCDGISKAFLILCRLENIACVRITGTSNGVGHAWNKVYIDDNWWGVDVTHGNLSINNAEEYLTYTQFMFTDNYKTETGCTFDTTLFATPTESYDVYSKISFEGVKGFDLHINSLNELNNLIAYVNAYRSTNKNYDGTTDHKYFTIEFAVDKSLNWTDNYVCVSKFGKTTYAKRTADDGSVTYLLKFEF